MNRTEQYSLSQTPILQDEWEFVTPIYLVQGIKGRINILELGIGDMGYLYGMASIINKVSNIVSIDYENDTEPGTPLYSSKLQVCETLYAQQVNCYGIELKSAKEDIEKIILDIAASYYIFVVEPFKDKSFFEKEITKYINMLKPNIVIFKGVYSKDWSYDFFQEMAKDTNYFIFKAPESNYGIGGIFKK